MASSTPDPLRGGVDATPHGPPERSVTPWVEPSTVAAKDSAAYSEASSDFKCSCSH